MTEVKQWAPHVDGRRTAFFDARPGVLVKVEPEAGGSSDAALAVARELADHASALARRDKKIERLTKQVELLSRELRVVNGRVPPPAPLRLLGVGYVRCAKDGRPWLLSRREGGWAEFGVRCESWDDLFRRYDVRVVDGPLRTESAADDDSRLDEADEAREATGARVVPAQGASGVPRGEPTRHQAGDDRGAGAAVAGERERWTMSHRKPKLTKRQRKGAERERVSAAQARAEAERHNQALREREARVEAERRRIEAMTREEFEAERARIRQRRVLPAIGVALAMCAGVDWPSVRERGQP